MALLPGVDVRYVPTLDQGPIETMIIKLRARNVGQKPSLVIANTSGEFTNEKKKFFPNNQECVHYN